MEHNEEQNANSPPKSEVITIKIYNEVWKETNVTQEFVEVTDGK